MVPFPHCLQHIDRQRADLPFLGHEVQIEERRELLLLCRLRKGGRVEPADEETEGLVIVVGQAVGGVFGAFLVVEEVAEEFGAVAEEFFVQDPVGVFGADVDVYEGGGEESVW